MNSKTYAISCRQVRKTYPHFELKDIDLLVPTGSVMGFVGPNGAGKSTTLRIIMGLVGPDAGEVLVLGHRMPAEQIAAKRDIGYVSEDMRLHPGQTIRFHMEFIASIFSTWNARYADELLQRFELTPDQKVKGLSHGQRVKAALLLALAREPKLLVLDEPTTGLDPVVRMEILKEMAAVLADESRSVIFSSHNTLDVEQISDHITFINRGSILFSEDKESLIERWRRLRLVTDPAHSLPELPGTIDIERDGRLASVIVDRFNEATKQLIIGAKIKLEATERLTLEEIFLKTVAHQSSATQEEKA